MRPRLVVKIVLAVATVALLLAAFVLALDTKDEESAYHGLQAITFAVLSLTTATAYRYCED